MFNALEPWHLLIIVGVLVVLFGAKRLPGSARSIGRSMRIFRSEMAAGRHEDTDTTDATATTDATSTSAAVAEPSAIRPAATTPVSTPSEDAAMSRDNATAARS